MSMILTAKVAFPEMAALTHIPKRYPTDIPSVGMLGIRHTAGNPPAAVIDHVNRAVQRSGTNTLFTTNRYLNILMGKYRNGRESNQKIEKLRICCAVTFAETGIAWTFHVAKDGQMAVVQACTAWPARLT
jgi:hypothetical protein